MGAIEFITPHVLAVTRHSLVRISKVSSYYHLELFFRLVVFDSENTIFVQFHEFRLEFGWLRLKLILLFVQLILHVQVVRVHILEQHLLKCPSRVNMVQLSEERVVDYQFDLPFSIQKGSLYRFGLN